LKLGLKEPVSHGSVELLKKEAACYSLQPPDLKRTRLLHGVLVMKPDGTLTIQDPEVAKINLFPNFRKCLLQSLVVFQ
jgi:hypothetical protein